MHSFVPLIIYLYNFFLHQPGKHQVPIRTSDAKEAKAPSVFDLVLEMGCFTVFQVHRDWMLGDMLTL